jgi:hypothetical protein
MPSKVIYEIYKNTQAGKSSMTSIYILKEGDILKNSII